MIPDSGHWSPYEAAGALNAALFDMLCERIRPGSLDVADRIGADLHHHIATLIGDPLRLIDDAVEFRQLSCPSAAR